VYVRHTPYCAGGVRVGLDRKKKSCVFLCVRVSEYECVGNSIKTKGQITTTAINKKKKHISISKTNLECYSFCTLLSFILLACAAPLLLSLPLHPPPAPSHFYLYLTPPKNVCGSGTAPLNSAFEKSNPGFSS